MSISTISNTSSSEALLRLLQQTQRKAQSAQEPGQTLPVSGQTQPAAAQMRGTGGAQLASNALSALFGMQSADSAEAPKGPPPGGQPPSAADMASQMMSDLDTDGDGKLSADEIKSALTAGGSSSDVSEALSKMDSDGDGAISTDELTTAFETAKPKEGQGRPPKLSGDDIAASIMSAFNTDGKDGLSLSEITSALGTDESSADKVSKKFSALDTDQNGVVNSAELAAGLKAQFAEATQAYSQANFLTT